VKLLYKIPVLLVMLMFASNDFAQLQAPDSMLIVVDNQTGESKVNTLINISGHYLTAQDTLSIRYASEALKLSKRMNYREGEGKAILFLGLSWADIKPDTALRYYLKSSEILSSLNHSWAHLGYKNAADIYITKGWYPEALECIYKGFEINQKTGDTLQMVESLSSLGFLHTSIQNYDEALHWQRKALEMLGNREQHTRRGLILGRIGINYDELGKYDSALYYNKLAIDCFRKAGNDVYVSQWMSNLANTCLKMNNFVEAERLLMEALRMNTLDDRKPNIFNNLAKVYIKTGRYHLARKAIDSTFYYASGFQKKELLSEAWYRTYELDKATGKIENALEAYIKYAVIRDSMLNETKRGQLAQMFARHETESKEKALLIEKAEKARIVEEKIEAELTVGRSRKWFWWGVLSTLIITLAGLLIYSRMKRTVFKEKNLAIIKAQESGLAAIIQAQEDERRKIAKDLHDGVGRQISAISMNFQAFTRKIAKDIPDLGKETEKIKSLIFDTSEEIRAISHQMMPRALTQLGLVDAMEDTVEISFKNSGIQVEFSIRGMEDRLSQEIETGIYRIAQELISNVIKHSGASIVIIELSQINNTILLTVKDDGIGIKQADNRGIGITNITSRVNALNGSFTIEALPGKGTLATVKISL
jgi:signal transduction histidine kinase